MSSLLLSVLSLLVCAAAASAAGAAFECINVKDLDVRTVALPEFPYVSLMECAHKCVAMDTRCSAYHYSNNQCHLLPPTESWSEQQQSSNVQICIKANGENPRCSAKNFPHAHGRSRYALSTSQKLWRDAAVHCEKMGSKLAQLTTSEERAYIDSLLTDTSTDDYTLNGLLQLPGHGSQHTNGWVWHRSGDPLLPGFWHSGEPNNHLNRQSIGAFYRSGQLDDYYRDVARKFLCECHIV